MAAPDPLADLQQILDGTLGEPADAFTLGGTTIARWVGFRLAVGVSLRFDHEAEPPSEWDAFLDEFHSALTVAGSSLGQEEVTSQSFPVSAPA